MVEGGRAVTGVELLDRPRSPARALRPSGQLVARARPRRIRRPRSRRQRPSPARHSAPTSRDTHPVGPAPSPGVINATGQPALSLPLGWPDDGLPRGVQFVAAYGREDVLVRLGAQLEAAAPWAHRRPTVVTTDRRRPLQSVGIALDIIDALAAAPGAGGERPRPPGRSRQEHGPPDVRRAGRPWTARPHRRRDLSARSPPRRVRGLATERTAIRDRGLPLLVELRNKLEETVQIGVPAGADVVYVERVEGRRALRYSTNARRSPIHRSSSGKVLAAFDPGLLEARLRAGLPPSTGYTIVVPELPGRGARPGSASGATPGVSTRPRWGCRRSPCRCAPRPTVRSWRRSRWSVPRRGSSATTRPTTPPCCRPLLSRWRPRSTAVTSHSAAGNPSVGRLLMPRRRRAWSKADTLSDGSTWMPTMPTWRAPSTHSGVSSRNTMSCGATPSAPAACRYAPAAGFLMPISAASTKASSSANSGRPAKKSRPAIV